MRESKSQYIESLFVQNVEALYAACRKVLGDSNEYKEIIEDSIGDTFVLCLQPHEAIRLHPNPSLWLHITCDKLLRENLAKYIQRNKIVILVGIQLFTPDDARDPADILILKETICKRQFSKKQSKEQA